MPKHVVLVGAGGNIGSHLGRNLARMQDIGRIVAVDRDVYERRNLVNQDILEQDLGQPKALVQARRLLEIRRDLEVRAIHAPLETLPLGQWRADLIVACLDSRIARQTVNERAWRLGVPWIDSGVLGWESLARVNVYTPGHDAPCLECAWSEDDYRMLEQLYPCAAGINAPAPNGATSELGALAAALLAVECRKMLAGEFDRAAISRQVTVNARWHRLEVTAFRRNERCRFDHAAWPIEPLDCRASAVRIGDLLAMAPAVRVPGQRFVRRLVCPACHDEKRLFLLAASLDADHRQCQRCGRPMIAPGFDIVESLDWNLPSDVKNLTLGEAGLRANDVLHAGARYLEILSNPL